MAKMKRSACSVEHSVARTPFANCMVQGASVSLIEFTFPDSGSESEPSSPTASTSIPKFLNRAAPLVLQRHHTLVSYHLIKQNDEASNIGNSTASYKDVQFASDKPQSHEIKRPAAVKGSKWYIILEWASRIGAPGTKEKRQHILGLVQEQLISNGAEVHSGGIYELICSANS
jgi:hypothetical protein